MKKITIMLTVLFALALTVCIKTTIAKDTGQKFTAAIHQHHDATAAVFATNAKPDYPDHPSCASANCHNDNTAAITPDEMKRINAMGKSADAALPHTRAAAVDIGNTTIFRDLAAFPANTTGANILAADIGHPTATGYNMICAAADIGNLEKTWTVIDQGTAANSPQPDQAKLNTTLVIPWRSLNASSSNTSTAINQNANTENIPLTLRT